MLILNGGFAIELLVLVLFQVQVIFFIFALYAAKNREDRRNLVLRRIVSCLAIFRDIAAVLHWQNSTIHFVLLTREIHSSVSENRTHNR